MGKIHTWVTNPNTGKQVDISNADCITTLETNLKNEIVDREKKDTELSNNIDKKQNKLTAGTGIIIDSNNVISAENETESWSFVVYVPNEQKSYTLKKEVLINTTEYEDWTFILDGGKSYNKKIGIKEV